MREYTVAFCKRGHLVTPFVINLKQRYYIPNGDPDAPRAFVVDRFCARCGSEVLVACPHCGDAYQDRSHLVEGAHPFCTSCGAPQPWASREDRVSQLVNLVANETLDEATMLAAREAIEELVVPVTGSDQSDDEITEAQVKAVNRLRTLVPGAWEFAKPVIQTVVTVAAKRRLGLEP